MDTGTSSWVRNQRMAYRQDDLTVAKVSQLQAVPGCTWPKAGLRRPGGLIS
jgi:hypothetical protein